MIGLLLILINLYMNGIAGKEFLVLTDDVAVAAFVEFILEWLVFMFYLTRKGAV